MPTICMLGDSHVAALRAGWKAIRDEFPDLRMTFFATPGATLRGLVEVDGRLVAGTDALSGYLKRSKKKVTTIEPGFDAYVICGLGLQLGRAAPAIRAFIMDQNSGTRTEEDLIAGIGAALRQSPAADTLAKLRRITPAPLGAVPAPMQGVGRVAAIFQKAGKSGTDKVIARAFVAACERVAQEHDAIFIPQLPQTLGASPLSTGPNYTTAPVKFFIYDLVEDNRHMNATYGELMMRAVLSRMKDENRTG